MALVRPAEGRPDAAAGRAANRGGAGGMWLMLGILVALTAVVALQETRYALLPTRQTPALWGSVLGAITAYLILRSPWGAGGDQEAEQRKLGTLSNSFYHPRREAAAEGGAVLGGVIGALWWGANSWMVLAAGMRRHLPARGLGDFEAAVVVGVLAGGIIGAVVGRLAGNMWERRHRAKRIARRELGEGDAGR